MQKKSLPDQETLQACLRYNPLTGELHWIARPQWTFITREGRTPEHMANAWNSVWAGKEAFTAIAKNGYKKGAFNGQNYYAHRIIWKLVHGTEPDDIDHNDGNKINNKLDNLFDRSRTDNLQNRRLSKNNTSGHHGVSWSKRHNLWHASIGHKNKSVHLGWFKLLDDAIAARKAAEKLYKYNENHGRTG